MIKVYFCDMMVKNCGQWILTENQCRGENMTVCYKKLWKLLIDKDMKKKDLCAKAGISPASVTKMGRNGHVTTEILLKICTALDCQIEDILEIVPDKESS